MKKLRKKAAHDREIEQTERSRVLPERFGKGFEKFSKLFRKVLKTVQIRKKDKWREAIKTEIES